MAAQTQRYVEAVKPHPVQVWDTRKTTPGWRLIEKAAVKDGGGTNHRMGLYDHAMVKDNHLAANSDLASLQAAIHKLRAERPGVRVQLEAVAAAQDLVAQEAGGAGLFQGFFEALVHLEDFAMDVVVAHADAHRVGRDDHAFDDDVRVELQDVTVLAGTRLALVGIAHQILLARE